MEERPPGLWASLKWELRIRAIAALIVALVVFATGLQGPLGFSIPEGVYVWFFPALVYVVSFEILGLLFAESIFQTKNASLFKTVLEYGFRYSAPVRWTGIIALILLVGWYIIEG